jgi:hypothetical protein
MKKYVFAKAVFFLFCVIICSAADLVIQAEDLRLMPEYTNDSMIETTTSINAITGYHLFVRKKPDIESVMLTETTRDPAEVEANYAFRALEWNAINGDEIRRLNGEVLTSEYARFSIIDSTPEADGQFGQAFHLFIPREMAFGYPWTRNGVTTIGQGTFINIRAFGAPYGDYNNGFQDNPFMFDFIIAQEPEEPSPAARTPGDTPPVAGPALTDAYSHSAASSFSEISGFNKGTLVYSRGIFRLPDEVIQSIDGMENKRRADIVLVIDATGSMKDAFAQLRRELPSLLERELQGFGTPRIGLVAYRDYVDSYRFEGFPVKMFPFTSSPAELEQNLSSIIIAGSEGGDIPEAVYEALYVAMEFYPWNSEAEQKIILIGDAEPHPTPRGLRKYSKELIQQMVKNRGITVDTIVLPDNREFVQ